MADLLQLPDYDATLVESTDGDGFGAQDCGPDLPFSFFDYNSAPIGIGDFWLGAFRPELHRLRLWRIMAPQGDFLGKVRDLMWRSLVNF